MTRNMLARMALLVTCSLGMTVQSGTSSNNPMRKSFQEGYYGRGIPKDCAGDEELHQAHEAGQQLASLAGHDDVSELGPRAYERGYHDAQKRSWLRDSRVWISGVTGTVAGFSTAAFLGLYGFMNWIAQLRQYT